MTIENRSPRFGEHQHSSSRFPREWWRPVGLLNRVLRFVLLLVASWTVMTFTHEMGHIIGGWICGGTLQSADLLPWHMPYSIFEPDPRPLVTLWCGPILGVVVPVGLAILIQRPWMWFVAHFCVLANGAYLATAWWSGDRYLDTPKLLEHGAAPLSIAIYCLLTIGFGYTGFRRACIDLLSSSAHGNVERPSVLQSLDERATNGKSTPQAP